eukprot:CAMPEP_0114259380 /NCGR_PEP_ID=MMETSP0058-20121206/19862_1 /TAXON_ID=36894 /ORGANISM="Pyramimonas parkeae, CCMP726" /LENGTH=691 /DNA_ID=CAMNT_0001374423 /DNA_START=298 /DNA_END=2374 /DNA_ORIENTATION=+
MDDLLRSKGFDHEDELVPTSTGWVGSWMAALIVMAYGNLSTAEPAYATNWEPQQNNELQYNSELVQEHLDTNSSEAASFIQLKPSTPSKFSEHWMRTLRYTALLEKADRGEVARVQFSARMDHLLVWVEGDSAPCRVTLVGLEQSYQDLVELLQECGVEVEFTGKDKMWFYTIMLQIFLMEIAAIQGVIMFMQKHEMYPFGMGKQYTRVDNTHTAFDDVAGCDAAKLELEELLEFLVNPDKYAKLGAKVPHGVLLAGPPGTGKTLLARALAGEAKCSFFTQSASSFVEMLSGVGAQRVRSLFRAARRQQGPSIVFIDEIDALGRQRADSGVGSGEREQTLNQLLIEMDGFHASSSGSQWPVLVIAATNRPEVLDKALVRPGRFDRHVYVGLPDKKGRLDILNLHAAQRKLAANVDLDRIARQTSGLSGAQLHSVVNEAAIAAARSGCVEVTQRHLDAACERVVLGPSSNSQVLSEKRRTLLAYHEAGHALVAVLNAKVSEQVSHVSIIPRGSSAGHTRTLPSESQLESGMYSRSYLEARMQVALAGRVSEELVFGKEKVTTSARDDLHQVSSLAHEMVKQFGFGKSLGQLALGSPRDHLAVMNAQAQGNGRAQHPHAAGGSYSEGFLISKDTANKINNDVRELVDVAYDETTKMLESHSGALHAIASALLENETISGVELRSICKQHNIES